MGKSPAKWIKTLLFGKKISKSIVSKRSAVVRRPHATANHHPLPPDDAPTELPSDAAPPPPRNAADTEEGFSFPGGGGGEQRTGEGVTKIQAAYRGYLARRAFRALKGIIRLQAVIRGHLVRRQGVATMRCVHAIVKLQARVRGRAVRRGSTVSGVPPGEPVTRMTSANGFCSRLIASAGSRPVRPVRVRYDPADPNSGGRWVARWSASRFWTPERPTAPPKSAKPAKKPPARAAESPQAEIERVKRGLRRVGGGETGPERRVEPEDDGGRVMRRKSLPVKPSSPPPPPPPVSVGASQVSPVVPSYMAATKSAKARARAHGSLARRHSLPSSVPRHAATKEKPVPAEWKR